MERPIAVIAELIWNFIERPIAVIAELIWNFIEMVLYTSIN